MYKSNLLLSLFTAWRCKKVGKLKASAPLATALHMLQIADMEIDRSVWNDLNDITMINRALVNYYNPQNKEAVENIVRV